MKPRQPVNVSVSENEHASTARFRYRSIPVAFLGAMGVMLCVGSISAIAFVLYQLFIAQNGPLFPYDRVYRDVLRLCFSLTGSVLWMVAAFMLWHGRFRVGTVIAIVGFFVSSVPELMFDPE